MSFLSGAETSSNANFIRYKSQKDQLEIDNQTVDLKPFVIDPNKIKLGWLHISQGAYDAHWFANPHVPIPRPEGIDSDGKPESTIISVNFNADNGVSDAGFNTTAFPAANAGPTL